MMITKEILEAQIGLYEKGRVEAVSRFETAKADMNAFNGAIEACQNLLRLANELEKAANKKPEAEGIPLELNEKKGEDNA